MTLFIWSYFCQVLCKVKLYGPLKLKEILGREIHSPYWTRENICNPWNFSPRLEVWKKGTHISHLTSCCFLHISVHQARFTLNCWINLYPFCLSILSRPCCRMYEGVSVFFAIFWLLSYIYVYQSPSY